MTQPVAHQPTTFLMRRTSEDATFLGTHDGVTVFGIHFKKHDTYLMFTVEDFADLCAAFEFFTKPADGELN